MRKILLKMFITLDGYAAFPKLPDILFGNNSLEKRKLEWDEIDKLMWTDHWQTIDTLILGRAAFLDWQDYWPKARFNPNAPKFEKEFSSFADKAQKVVFSKTIEHSTWQNTTIVKTSIVDEITSLKNKSGTNMAIGGGATIAQTFLKLGLIDEFYLTIFPVILGKGKRIFNELEAPTNLQLVKSKTLDSGIQIYH